MDNVPIWLSKVPNSPKKLFIKGKILPSDEFSVAIVGSRTPTKYGEEVARFFASYLAQKKVTIVSGLARGIDTIAHQEALKAGGRTIAVVGSGLDIIYPLENKKLFDQIAKNGAVISEFKNGMPPLAKNFLQRNRIISGISLAVLVIEGAKRSGTLSISSKAAEQGKEVFAVPGPIFSEMSFLPHYLISNGAKIAIHPEDIYSFLCSEFDKLL